MTRLLLMLMIAMTAAQDSTQTAGNPDPDLVYAVKGAQHLRFLTDDPGTFKLSLVVITDSGNVCYQYQARNGLGGTDVDTAVFPKSARNLTDENHARFVFMDSSAWKRYCVEGTTFKWHLRNGKDVTEDVNKALKATTE